MSDGHREGVLVRPLSGGAAAEGTSCRGWRIPEFRADRIVCDDVMALRAPIAGDGTQIPLPHTELKNHPTVTVKAGVVYVALLKIGRERCYKIGKAILVERRTDQMSL
jgi:hypothetical protein